MHIQVIVVCQMGGMLVNTPLWGKSYFTSMESAPWLHVSVELIQKELVGHERGSEMQGKDVEFMVRTEFSLSSSICRLIALSIGEGNGNPLQCSCLQNPRDRGARWAAVHEVAQSWTRLKQLSSSSRFKVQGVGGGSGNNPLQILKDNFLVKICTFIVLLFVFSFIPSALFICESESPWN